MSPTAADLLDIAYKKERAASRKLARVTGISEDAALRRTLEAAATNMSLTELIAVRRQARANAKEAMIANRQARLEMRKQKNAQILPAGAWLAWFDGSSHPNPGRIGIGGLLQGPDGTMIEISCPAGHGDSSAAEYLALNAVLEAAVAAQPEQLIIHGDSQVVIDDIRGTRHPSAALTMQRERAMQTLGRLRQVSFVWIPRHRNTRADALSQQAVKRTTENVPLAD